MNGEFLIPMNGLAGGKTSYLRHAGKEFFISFENSDIHDAELAVEIGVEKIGRKIFMDCRITGSVVVSCDRCLEDLTIPVDVPVKLEIKFGDSAEEIQETGQGRETVVLPHNEDVLDMEQIVYDYVCTSLPVKKVHPEGECDAEVMRHLGNQTGHDGDGKTSEGDSPFSALKNYFRN